MSLTQDIARDLTQAMKERTEPKLSTLRMLKAELQKLQADKGRSAEITDDDVYTVIKRLIKQRKDAAEQYTAGGANDRAESELAEIKILEPYLPKQLSDEQIDAFISEAAKEINASSPKDMGRLMKAVMAKAKGQADGARVKERVNAFLN
ncbi:MAG: GatB/YqeY domain-containing protein [Synergistales bacterium]|nr:GatB/YqeY domain-containing protein [Synergistales bacterium]MDY6401279.1 GatB/YqeY domain-containing protein [Synergistales bacterium]MDY6404381.1 GatB/YqeY domain-containing protein [Synergistales bacterium]MDY6410260.1 GatB/YqeY domain-containing protein [Synergistales bacterium]MDY6414273.1 GatB/YqeY domain-containing protein [Synergistales bacterium]